MTDHPLTPYVRRLANLMGLSNWHVTVTVGDTVEEDSYAEITPWSERFRGDIVLNSRWKPENKEDVREILVHELLHLHFASLDQAVGSLDTLLGKPAYTVFRDRYNPDREKAVQQIARFWSPTLPLPPTHRISVA